MTREELDSLTVCAGAGSAAHGVELMNSSGHVAYFPDRDAAYAEIRRLRGFRTEAEKIAHAYSGDLAVFGPNDDARLTCAPDALCALGGYVAREYGDHGYRVGQVANAGGGGVFSVRTSDGSTFYLVVDRWGNVARIEDADTKGDRR